MAYRHGVYVKEQQTAITSPITVTAGLQVVIGTAPVNLAKDPYGVTNVPVLVQTFADAAEKVGYCEDFDKYTACQSINASLGVFGVAPVAIINVLDPKKHKADVPETECQVNKGIATLAVEGVLLDTLTVKASGVLTEGDDYVAYFDEAGHVVIAVVPGGAAAQATTLTVSGTRINPDEVTAEDIVGAVASASAGDTGIQAVRTIYPKLGMVPGILVAPKFSTDPAVAAALQAATEDINGSFSAFCVVDIDSSSDGAQICTDVQAQKEVQAVSSPNCYAVWPCVKVGDNKFHGSAIAAALMAYTDAQNDDVPHASPSNKVIPITEVCLEDGTSVLLDQDQANTVNAVGVGTFLRMNGFRMWGNRTACYPSNTDPKDCWVGMRRFLNWDANAFILTYFSKVDGEINARLIESIVDSENIRGNGFVSRGICARYELTYNEAENSAAELMDGKITFRKWVALFPPAEEIVEIVEFDPYALSAALA